MPISMLKYIKIHKNTLTCFDLNRSSSGSMYLIKGTELFKKNTEFKILKIIPGVVAEKRLEGMRGDPFGAVR